MAAEKADAIVLGIDAAWTSTQPSGVALLKKEGGHWRLLAASPSDESFLSLGEDGCDPPTLSRAGSRPEDLLSKAAALAGGQVSLVAVDMPVSSQPITGRRYSDDSVSRAFGAFGCGTHTPSPARPGQIGQDLSEGFAAAGYPLATRAPLIRPGLIEVYPHPALLYLMEAKYRIAYKVSRIHRYWPHLPPAVRRTNLLRIWREIIAALESSGIALGGLLNLPSVDATRKELKSFEDTLDAVICAWVGVCVLQERAVPYGDDHSAIWIPTISSLGLRRSAGGQS
jgi:predicted RNase H-like nuclease